MASQKGCRYLLGHSNFTLAAFLALLTELFWRAGNLPRFWRVRPVTPWELRPRGSGEKIADHLTGQAPKEATLTGVRLA